MKLLLFIKSTLLLALFTIPTLQATTITLDASNTAQATAVTSLSWSHETSGIQSVLIVSVITGSNAIVQGISYDGSPLVEASSASINSMTVTLWYLSAPSSGSHNIDVQLNSPGDILACSHSYNGVDQLTPFRNISSLSGNSSNASTTIISDADDLVIDVAGFINVEASAGPGQKEISLQQGSLNAGCSLEPGASVVEMSWFNATDQWAQVTGSLQAPAPLPVELVSFDATVETYKVRLDWLTASETRNAFFLVEKSIDGVLWEIVNKVAGAGNSDDYQSYSIYDHQPYAGTSYYRLKQVDFNDNYVVIDPISIRLATLTSALKLFPNPTAAGEALNIVYKNAAQTEALEIRLIDRIGRLVQKESFQQLPPGTTVLSVDLHSIKEEGLYFVQLVDQTTQLVHQEKVFISKK